MSIMRSGDLALQSISPGEMRRREKGNRIEGKRSSTKDGLKSERRVRIMKAKRKSTEG